MSKTFLISVVAAVSLALASCVTINVYFPAAAAERAAQEFVGKVIGEQPSPSSEAETGREPQALLMRLLEFLIPVAHARPDIDIRTPQIQAIQARMAERFQNVLRPHFDSGALGFTRDGLIEIVDPGKIPLRERAAVQQAVAEDNRDRNAVYREIAVANGHPEWEADIRAIFARQWIEQARPGWRYQDGEGRWTQK